jgi:hypothetical protein
MAFGVQCIANKRPSSIAISSASVASLQAVGFRHAAAMMAPWLSRSTIPVSATPLVNAPSIFSFAMPGSGGLHLPFFFGSSSAPWYLA